MIQLWNFLFHFTWCKNASSNSQWQWMTVKVGLTFLPKNVAVPVHRLIAGAAPSVAKPIPDDADTWCVAPESFALHIWWRWQQIISYLLSYCKKIACVWQLDLLQSRTDSRLTQSYCRSVAALTQHSWFEHSSWLQVVSDLIAVPKAGRSHGSNNFGHAAVFDHSLN